MGLRRKLATWAKKKYPDNCDYEGDGLKVYGRDVSFLSDEKFMEAYRFGMNSGHKIGRAKDPSRDIHIEWRASVCCWAAFHAKHLSGDFVECGTNTGIFSLAICKYLNFNSINKDFYLFDTFSGIPVEQISAQEKGKEEHNNMYEECYALAAQNFSPFPRAKLVRGKIPDTLQKVAIEKVAYLHIDMNIVYPEQAALAYFWDKVVAGGIILFDDYGFKAHGEQKKAHDAFAQAKGVQILLLPTGQGLLIKP